MAAPLKKTHRGPGYCGHLGESEPTAVLCQEEIRISLRTRIKRHGQVPSTAYPVDSRIAKSGSCFILIEVCIILRAMALAVLLTAGKMCTHRFLEPPANVGNLAIS